MRLNKHTNLNKGARGINEIDNGINNMALERVLRRCESGVITLGKIDMKKTVVCLR